MKSLLRYIFAGPKLRSRILKQIKLREHSLQMGRNLKDARTFRWIKRDEEILKILNNLL